MLICSLTQGNRTATICNIVNSFGREENNVQIMGPALSSLVTFYWLKHVARSCLLQGSRDM